MSISIISKNMPFVNQYFLYTRESTDVENKRVQPIES